MKILSEYPDLLTVQEVCAILRVGRRTVYKYINNNTLHSRKIAGKHRVQKISVKNFVHEINGNLCYNNISDDTDALHKS